VYNDGATVIRFCTTVDYANRRVAISSFLLTLRTKSLSISKKLSTASFADVQLVRRLSYLKIK